MIKTQVSRRGVLSTAVITAVCVGGLSLLLPSGSAQAATGQVGTPAPDFEAVDTQGNTVKLSELKGQTVILEWTNHDCPYVRKHYETGNMQALQKEAAADGVTWLSIISSAPGTQGHVSPDRANALTVERQASPSAVIIDEPGKIGRAFGARVTPHMYIIDDAGTLVFNGAVDDNRSARHATVETANNYVRAALADMEAGREIAAASPEPYGCSVKY